MPARRALAVLLAVTLAPLRAGAAGTCPNERSDASDSDNLRSCLDDAREANKAGEARLSAAAYARAVEYAGRAYATGSAGAQPAWFTGSGEQLVYYGTEGCSHGGELGPAEARGVHDACIALLETYIADLTGISAQDSRSGQVMHKRLEEVKALRAALPAPEPAPAPAELVPPAPVVVDRPMDTVVAPEKPARPPPFAPRPPPRGLQAGFGVSLGVTALAVAGLAGAGVWGRNTAEELIAGNTTPDGQPICETLPTPAQCSEHKSAKSLYVASGVLVGVGLVSAVVFGALWARDSRVRSKLAGIAVAPHRTGLSFGLTLRF